MRITAHLMSFVTSTSHTLLYREICAQSKVEVFTVWVTLASHEEQVKTCVSTKVTHSSLQLEFSPQTLCCYGKQLCTIPRDATYYSYQNR